MSYKEYLNYLLDVFEEIINDIKEIKETYNSNNDILNKKITDYDNGYYTACIECITNNIYDLEEKLYYDLNFNNEKNGENEK